MNTTYERLCRRANGEASYLAQNARLLTEDLPQAGSVWENLAATRYLPHSNWESAACAYELAGDAWMHVGQREFAAQNYGLAALYYDSAGCGAKALEMQSMVKDVPNTRYA
jgi:hypothetical protein